MNITHRTHEKGEGVTLIYMCHFPNFLGSWNFTYLRLLFAKIFPSGKIGFFQLLNRFTVCEGNNQDHDLTFDVLYWVGNVTQKYIDKVRFEVPPRLLLTVFYSSPLFVCFLFFLPPWLVLLHLFLEMFAPTYWLWHMAEPNHVFFI